MSTPQTPLATEILQQAREAILAKNYGLARMLLNTLPRDPRAQKWLAKLDEIAPDNAEIHTDRPTFSAMMTESDAPAPEAIQRPQFEESPTVEPALTNVPLPAFATYMIAGSAGALTVFLIIAEVVTRGFSSAVLVYALGGTLIVGWLLLSGAMLAQLRQSNELQRRHTELLARIERHLR